MFPKKKRGRLSVELGDQGAGVRFGQAPAGGPTGVPAVVHPRR